MIVTDKFVFVHLPRSGGTFVSQLIRKFFPSGREIGYHLPCGLLPKEYSHLPVLGAVRNPWDFYVSWYYHVWPRDADTPLISWISENGTVGFHGATKNALNLGTNNERVDALIDILPERVDFRTRNIPNITKEAIRNIRGTGVGYYTFRFNHLFGKAENLFVCRFEKLRQDLLTFFDTIGITNDDLRDHVLLSEKVNTAEHLHYSTYYTDELAELVRIRDRQLIERFGYTFEKVASKKGDRTPTIEESKGTA